MNILDGRAIAITGAGGGLGRAYALHAARFGAAVVVNDIDAGSADETAAAIVAAGGRAVADHHSVADPSGAKAVVDTCVERFGVIDGLVNNAGVHYHHAPWASDPARMRGVIEVNVLGTLFCGAAAIAHMRDRGRGVIVNVASGAMLGQTNAAAYAASKGAVAAMTSSWAADLVEHGIRVNAVCPLAWTPMMAIDPRKHVICSPDRTPDLIAPVVTYLLSDLSAGITGQLVRFVGDKLCLVRQHAVKEPVLQRDDWDVDDIALAFDTTLRDALEPHPSTRWTLKPYTPVPA